MIINVDIPPITENVSWTEPIKEYIIFAKKQKIGYPGKWGLNSEIL